MLTRDSLDILSSHYQVSVRGIAPMFICVLAWIGELSSPLHTSLQRLMSQISCVVMIYTNQNTNIYFLEIYL